MYILLLLFWFVGNRTINQLAVTCHMLRLWVFASMIRMSWSRSTSRYDSLAFLQESNSLDFLDHPHGECPSSRILYKYVIRTFGVFFHEKAAFLYYMI